MNCTRSKWLNRKAMPLLPFLRLCLSQADFDKACKGIKQPSTPWLTPGFQGRVHVFENVVQGTIACIVCIDAKGLRYEVLAGLIIHEAVHVWQHYRDDVLNDRNPSSECEAYVIQNIAQTLLEAYGEQRRG